MARGYCLFGYPLQERAPWPNISSQSSRVTGPRPNPIGTVVAWILFLIVIAGVVLGITFIVASGFGKQLSFEHIFPTIVDKH